MKDLCLSLAAANMEAEIVQILKDEGYWDNPSYWELFAGIENSFSIIGNQQALPESALVEKIINSVDAVLMAECMKRGIDPESPQAPQNIWEAVEEFFEIRDGLLYNISARERTSLAEKSVNVVATGAKSLPSYSFIDFGEGQSAKTMPHTLLSLAGSNKLRIPFVQGKFNMGGTGVFLFCGDKNIQFMTSRRHPEVALHEKDDETRNDWCFTVVRREDPREGQKSSVFTYLAPKGKIPRFKAEALPIFPGPYPEPDGRDMEYGTFIKIIEYQIPRYKTNLTLDMYNRLNCLLPRLALPVRLWERRKPWGKGTHTFETTMSGLDVRLEEDKRGMTEFKSSSTFDIDGSTLPTTIYAFKKAEQAARYRNEEGVIFVQNGQTHGHLPKDFFKGKKVGMLNIADLLLIEVNCDALSRRAREKLFMTSRDRLRHGQMRKDIQDQLRILISEHQGLRELREKRKREEVQDRLAKSQPLENVLQKIINKSPTLAKLLGTGMRITNPFKSDEAQSTEKFVGRQFPTFFDIKTGKSGKFSKGCYLNQRFRVQFVTDAENNYFKRNNDPGELTVYCDGDRYGSGVVNLWKGIATLNLELPEAAEEGSSYNFEVVVTDASQINPFRNSFKVNVIGEASKGTPTKGGRRKDPLKRGKGKDQKPTQLGAPEVYEATKEQWEKYGFDHEGAICLRQEDAEQYYFVCNVDNVYLKNEQKTSKDDALLLKEQFKYGLALVSLALLNEKEKVERDDDEEYEDNDEMKIDEQIFYVTRALSPFILPIVRELGGLE